MRFTVTMYLALDAASEDEARKIVNTIELTSKYSEHIFWDSLHTEPQKPPYKRAGSL